MDEENEKVLIDCRIQLEFLNALRKASCQKFFKPDKKPYQLKGCEQFTTMMAEKALDCYEHFSRK